jgi:ribosomal protein S18 acetylase RimI-like enzyme
VEKTEKMRDGKDVVIRGLEPDDLDKLMAFYRSLPLEDRKYLRVDVTDKKIVARRMNRVERGEDIRIVALRGGEIVADGHIELSGEQWSKHQGEIRVIVSRDFQNAGLGTIMIRELYFIAVQRNLEILVARMMRPQGGAQKIFRKLGFRETQLLPDFVRDLEGASQDLIVMTCDLKDLWKQLDRLFSESDWERCR